MNAWKKESKSPGIFPLRQTEKIEKTYTGVNPEKISTNLNYVLNNNEGNFILCSSATATNATQTVKKGYTSNPLISECGLQKIKLVIYLFKNVYASVREF